MSSCRIGRDNAALPLAPGPRSCLIPPIPTRKVAARVGGQISMSESSTGICLLGCGIVGSGVAKILADQADLLKRRVGARFDIRHVVVRDLQKHKMKGGLPFTTNAPAAIDDPSVQIVLELMGGISPTGELVERALKLGKPVVTANKSLLAAR